MNKIEDDFCNLITYIHQIAHRYKKGVTIEDRIIFDLCNKVIEHLENILYDEDDKYFQQKYKHNEHEFACLRNQIFMYEKQVLTYKNEIEYLKEQISLMEEKILCNIKRETNTKAPTINTTLLNEDNEKYINQKCIYCSIM